MAPSTSHRHPLHPATVHFPIAFIVTGSMLNILTHYIMLVPFLRSLVLKVINPKLAMTENSLTTTLNHVSFGLLLFGALATLPALATGMQELWLMTSGFKTLNSKAISQNSKLRTTLLHAVLSDVAFAGTIYNLWSRSNLPDFAFLSVNTWVSGGVLIILLGSAFLGGKLVFDHGVGVSKMSIVEKTNPGKKEL